MRLILGLLFWLFSLVIFAAPVVEGEKLRDFPGRQMNKQTQYTNLANSPTGQVVANDSSGNLVVIGGKPTLPQLVAERENISNFPGQQTNNQIPYTSVAYSSDGQFIVSGSSDNIVRVWDAQSGEILKTLQGHNGAVWSVAYSPDRRFIASGSNDKTVRIWDADTGENLKTLQGHSNWIRSLAFSPDGKMLVSGSDDKTIRLWDVNTGSRLKTLQGHSHWIWSLAFSPNGKVLASGSNDKTIRLWDVETGSIQKILIGHRSRVISIAFSSNGKTLVSGSANSTTYLWDTLTGENLGMRVGWEGGDWVKLKGKGYIYSYSRELLSSNNNWVHAAPASANPVQNNFLKINTLENISTLNGGEFNTISLIIKNISEDLIYWLKPQFPSSLNSRFILKQLPSIYKLNPRESITLNLEVAPLFDEIQPRDDKLTIKLSSFQLRKPIQTTFPVKVNAPKLQLSIVEWLSNESILKVRIDNRGTQSISNTVFKLHVPGNTELDEQTVTETIAPQAFLERSFSLPKDFELDKDDRINLQVSNQGRLPMTWEFNNQTVTFTRPPWWRDISLALLMSFSLAGAYYYRLFRHPLVIELSNNSLTLNTLNLDQLPRAKLLLTQTRRLSTILDKAEVSPESFNHALDFPNATPQQKAQQLARRLGATAETLNAEQGLFRLKLNPDFPLNTERLLLYFPQVATEDTFTTLKTLPKTAGRITLIIGPDNNYQLKLLNTTSQLDNKYVAPRSSQLTEWLLSPNAETVLAKIMSEQLSLTQISPYQIGGGVDNESVFFGRRELIAQITNRDPANYLLVGGRQMGKSTLLKALQRRYADNPTIQCHYLTLSNEILIRRLANELELPRTDDPEALAAELEQLHKQAGKHLVLLIDEADRFIQHEQQNDYPILNVFRRLSEQGQCTFIFAGFWQLYRHAVLDYQSPLRNFGEVLEIGALESDACYDLATQPMATMNLNYASEAIVHDMVNACGQRANLIAFACHHLLQRLEPKQRVIEAGDIQGILIDRKMSEKAVMGWSLGNNPQEQRYEHLIIYSTIDRESFSTGELIRELQDKGVEVDVPVLENCLSRLQLAYVLQRVGNRWQYCVPLFVDYVAEDDPDVKLETVLKI